MSKNKFRKSVLISENQHDALPFILRSIALKAIPLTGNTLAYFSSHPDLHSPTNMNADMVYQPEELFAHVTAGSWILPLVYAGHISKMVWFRPPWSSQFIDGVYEFFVGKCPKTQQIKCSCLYNYFFAERAYCAADKLENRKPFRLIVLMLGTVGTFAYLNYLVFCRIEPDHPDAIQFHENEPALKSLIKTLGPLKKGVKCRGFDPFKVDFDEDAFGDSEIFKTLVGTKEWILCIDLTFFSTQDPLVDMLKSEDNLIKYRDVYTSTPPALDEESLEIHMDYIERRNEAIGAFLEGIIDQDESVPEDSYIGILADAIVEEDADWRFVHDYGVKYSNTSFPHHPSSEAEINYLFSSVEKIMSTNQPAYICIFQSKEDDLCPAKHRRSIQEKLFHKIKRLFPDIKVIIDITEDGRRNASF